MRNQRGYASCRFAARTAAEEVAAQRKPEFLPSAHSAPRAVQTTATDSLFHAGLRVGSEIITRPSSRLIAACSHAVSHEGESVR